MITETLLMLFSFFSLFFLAIGIWSRSPVITIAGATTFIFTGLALIVGGVQEYDGKANTTLNYTYTSNGSVDSITTTQAANYIVIHDLTTSAWSIAMILSGLVGVYYGATIPASRKAT